MMTDHGGVKDRVLIQPTKKMDCPVQIKVSRVIIIDLDKVQCDNVTGESDTLSGKVVSRLSVSGRKRLISSILEYYLAASTSELQERYIFNLPDNSEHKYHNTGSLAGLTLPVHPEVREKLQTLCSEKRRTVTVINELSDEYVRYTMGVTDSLDKRFYPDRRTIRNIVMSVKQRNGWTAFDLPNADRYLDSWFCSNPMTNQEQLKHERRKNDNLFYRLRTKPIVLDDSVIEDDANKSASNPELSSDEQLLIVFQSSDMANLYRMYGHSGILMDATYRTCMYTLPLYFIVVRTNIGYQPVCMFMTRHEKKDNIVEALQIFRGWNPDVVPMYGLVDYAWEEILALEEVWEGMRVFLCSFHREQAWTRWTKKSVSKEATSELLKGFRAIAHACDKLELEAAENRLKASEHCTIDSPAWKYFEQHWMSEIHRWCLAYRPLDLLFESNNGVERLNKELKYGHLYEKSRCSLFELLQTLMEDFLPKRFSVYVTRNVKMMPSHKLYAQQLDVALHKRPNWLIRYLEKKAALARADLVEQVIVRSNVEYLVPSEEHDSTYTVSIDGQNSTCTCKDFWRNRMPCKHFFLVGMKNPECHPYRKLDEILVSPVYRMDAAVTNANSEEASDTSALSQPENISKSTAVGKKTVLKSTPDSAKRKHVKNCEALIRSIQSRMWQLSEENVIMVEDKLKLLDQQLEAAVPVDELGMTNAENCTIVSCQQERLCSISQRAIQRVDSSCVIESYEERVCDQAKEVDKSADVIMSDQAREVDKSADVIVCDQAREVDGKVEEVVSDNAKESQNSKRKGFSKLSLRNKPKRARVGAAADREREGRENELCKGIPVDNIQTLSSSVDRTSRKTRTVNLKPVSGNRKHVSTNGFCVSFVEINRQCQPGVRLEDDVINFAQKIIMKQNPVEGLQDVLIGLPGEFVPVPYGVQIIHNGANHWVTVLTSGTTVMLYDSLGLPISPRLAMQMASLLGCISGIITVHRMNVQLQEYNDCGVLAIAFAWALASGRSPEELTFHPNHVRRHLMSCLLNEKFTDFPPAIGRVQNVPRSAIHVKI
jgi:hypothetical protein